MFRIEQDLITGTWCCVDRRDYLPFRQVAMLRREDYTKDAEAGDQITFACTSLRIVEKMPILNAYLVINNDWFAPIHHAWFRFKRWLYYVWARWVID